MRVTRGFALLGFMLAVALPSLAQTAVYTAYSGSQRPDSEVAILELAAVDWVRIDRGERIERGEYGRIKLLPGTHRIEWCTTFVVSPMIAPRGKAAHVAQEDVVLEAGHVYVVSAGRSGGRGYGTFFWIEDTQSHDIVAGFKKPKWLLPGQVNPGEYVPRPRLEALYGRAGRKGVYSKDKRLQSFFEATLAGNRAETEALVSAGVDLNATDRDGATALIRAALENLPGTIELLMDLGADVNARIAGEDRFTALMVAAENGHPEVVRLLLRSTVIDVNAQSNGHTALNYAILHEESEVRELLRAHPDCDESLGAVFLKKAKMMDALAEKADAADMPSTLTRRLVWEFGTADRSNERDVYCPALKRFIKIIEAKKGKKISHEDANDWVSDAESIIELACTTPDE